MDKYILDDNGNPIKITDPLQLENWYADRDNEDRTIARTTFEGRAVVISTVFLGMDFGLGTGPPLIFETMLFHGDGSGEEKRRYATRRDAIAGHTEMVKAYILKNPFEKVLNGKQKIGD